MNYFAGTKFCLFSLPPQTIIFEKKMYFSRTEVTCFSTHLLWRCTEQHVENPVFNELGLQKGSFHTEDFPGGSDGKASAYNAGDLGSIPGSGRTPGEGNGTPLQYSCLENPMDRGAWQATDHGVTKSQTRLNIYVQTCKTNSVQYNGLQSKVSCFAEDPGCHMLKGTGNLGSNRLRPVNYKETKTNKG